MILQYIADEDQLQSLIFWNFGSLLKITWSKFYIVLFVLVVCFLILFKNAWKLTAMTLDDSKAKSIGVDTGKVRRLAILISSLLSAVAVSFVGNNRLCRPYCSPRCPAINRRRRFFNQD